MNQDDYEPPEIHVYHVELTEDHVRELRQTGEIVCTFDPEEAMTEDGPDSIEIVVETDSGSAYRVDDLVE